MKRSFRDPATGVLKSFGFVESGAPGDLAQDEPDDFALEPGKWQLVAGAWVAYGPPPDQLKAAGAAAIQQLLDGTAQEHGYDNIVSLCSYSLSTNVKWQKEGQYGRDFRDACWGKAQEIQDAALAGNWPTTGAGQIPTNADVMAAMPPVAWPV